MTYTSLKSPTTKDYKYTLNVAHLYGNLLNTYGDNGNILMMKYVGEKLGCQMTFDIVSLEDRFDPNYYQMVVDKTTNKPLLHAIFPVRKKTLTNSFKIMV